MHCTQCGSAGAGRFCSACGATLLEMPCPACAVASPPGGRFCNECGSSLRTAAGPGRTPTPAGASGGSPPAGADAGWWISGVLLVVLLVLGGWVFLSVGDPGGDDGLAAGMMAGADDLGPAPHIDLTSMSREEAADALFNRVMNALARGERAEAERFLPMAIGAYEIAAPLDLDGLFHLSLLHSAGGEFGVALATAEEALARDEDHLLNLAAAAEASRSLGDDAAARERYAHLLAVWDREMEREDRAEYEHHEGLLPEIRADAESYLAEGAR
jgi:hypothetical protein